MDFTIDRSAPTLPETCDRLNAVEIESILPGAIQICRTEQDNDTEAWYFTQAGQFVRVTGSDQDRFYVVPADDARDALEGMLAEDRFAALFPSEAPAP